MLLYAGDDLQAVGANYLMSVDAKLSRASVLDREIVRLDLVQRTTERETETICSCMHVATNALSRDFARAMDEAAELLAKTENPLLRESFFSQTGPQDFVKCVARVLIDAPASNSPKSSVDQKRSTQICDHNHHCPTCDHPASTMDKDFQKLDDRQINNPSNPQEQISKNTRDSQKEKKIRVAKKINYFLKGIRQSYICLIYEKNKIKGHCTRKNDCTLAKCMGIECFARIPRYYLLSAVNNPGQLRQAVASSGMNALDGRLDQAKTVERREKHYRRGDQ